MTGAPVSSPLDGAEAVVTGGAGFIGSHVVELLSQRESVTIVDDLSVGRLENVETSLAKSTVRFVRADVRDPDALRRAFDGASVVFHLAVQCLRLSLSDPSLVHEVNATGTLNALRAATEAGVRRFVYVSSSEVYGSAADGASAIAEDHALLPTTPYGASKAAGELYAMSYLRSHGLAVTVVRPFNAFGPRSHALGPYGEVIPRFVARVLQGDSPVIFGDGLQTRDFTYVEDTARGIVAAAAPSASGSTINLGSGRETTIRDLAGHVLRACGRDDLGPMFEDARPGDVRRHLAATGASQRLLGFRPTVDLAEGLRRYVAWIHETGVEVGAVEAGAANW